ncbi:MAG: 30S ribosomal protein S1 [Candidatus Saganbacteria bacterium]|nr:30S ribosomal protein S1 [Candidatus Saganbacteria bacterium]
MAEEYLGTSIEKGKGSDEFMEVEALIQETLAETKRQAKAVETAPPVAEAKPEPAPKKEASMKATTMEPKSKPKPAAPADKAETPPAQPTTYESTFKEYKPGDIVKGTVMKVEPGAVLVDIKYKADGIILPEELSDRSSNSPEEIVKVGDVINVFIENLENKEGYVVLSKTRADHEKRWHVAFDAKKNRTLLEGKVVQVVKGGLVVECDGVRGFVPASQVMKRGQESLDAFKDQTIPVKVIEVNRRQGKIIMSHRLGAGEKVKQESSKIFDEIEVGQTRKGTVSSLKNFGAFVNLGGVEGLIHLSELSWKRVKHPSEVLKVGQELDVFVLGVDRVNKKIALGLKELQPDPWERATQLFKPGQVIKVKVLRFCKFGAFADLGNDLEGLIHISEMSKEPIEKPEDAGVKIGDEVEVKVLRVLPEEQKIGLSIKAAKKQREKQEIRETLTQEQEKQKVTIGDIIAQKEKERAEREAEEVEDEEEAQVEPGEAPAEGPGQENPA